MVVRTICNDWGRLGVYTCGEGTVCYLVFALLLALLFCLLCSFAPLLVLLLCLFLLFPPSYLAIGMVLVSRVRLANTSTLLLTLLALVRR
jgi:hypothetical protein